MQSIFYIPEKSEYIFVSDMFAADYTGGAELTLDAIAQACLKPYFQIRSSAVTASLVEKYKNKHWILVNFSQMPHEALVELVVSKVKFSIIECDYKYCMFRSSHLHKLQTGKECDCHNQKIGKFIRALFAKANKVFFMSQEQMNVYKTLFPEVNAENFLVQSSTFKSETLDHLAKLRQNRNLQKVNEKYVILKGGTWIKAESDTIAWAQKAALDYELIGGLPPEQFLNELAKYKGLIFRPAGFDTCPRLVIEAKLLGLDCLLNENVQHKNEAWFCGSINECEDYLKNRPTSFWKKINDNQKS